MKINWRWIVHFAYLFVIIILIGAFVHVSRKSTRTEFEWKFGNQTLKLNAQRDLQDPEKMFEKLFETDFSKAGTLALLRKRKIYALDDSSLVEVLKNFCANQVSKRESLQERTERLSKCFEMETLKQIRELARDHLPPFQYVGKLIKVGTPGDPKDLPSTGRANVCADGGFLGHMVEITDPDQRGTITVQASGWYTCTGVSDYADIQIRPEEAKKLFNRGTRKYEEALAVIVQ